MADARLLSKPLIGGPFGSGRYALASVPAVCKGLHGARFMVVDGRAGAVLSVADGKEEAIATARRVLQAASELSPANDGAPTQAELFPREEPDIAAPLQRVISRRRQEIFRRTGGRCFYCSAALELDGPWHIEHQMPRALGGADAALNLVPACSRCNLQKSDSTAVEYFVRLAEQGAQP